MASFEPVGISHWARLIVWADLEVHDSNFHINIPLLQKFTNALHNLRGGSNQLIRDDYWSPRSEKRNGGRGFVDIDGERGEEGVFWRAR